MPRSRTGQKVGKVGWFIGSLNGQGHRQITPQAFLKYLWWACWCITVSTCTADHRGALNHILVILDALLCIGNQEKFSVNSWA